MTEKGIELNLNNIEHSMDLNIDEPNTNDIELIISASFINVEGDIYPKYKGGYEVIPKFINQELETKNTVLTKNVEVKEIPVQKAENLGGGYTVTIGG